MLTVIVGPPCSGKSTYVRERAQPGDVVIDFDTMAQAFGSPESHKHNDAIRHVTIHARRAAIEAAIRTHLRGHTVWIVDGDPHSRHAHLYEQAGASVITLSADAKELHRRAGKERPKLWHKLIDDWGKQRVTPTNGSRQW